MNSSDNNQVEANSINLESSLKEEQEEDQHKLYSNNEVENNNSNQNNLLLVPNKNKNNNNNNNNNSINSFSINNEPTNIRNVRISEKFFEKFQQEININNIHHKYSSLSNNLVQVESINQEEEEEKTYQKYLKTKDVKKEAQEEDEDVYEKDEIFPTSLIPTLITTNSTLATSQTSSYLNNNNKQNKYSKSFFFNKSGKSKSTSQLYASKKDPFDDINLSFSAYLKASFLLKSILRNYLKYSYNNNNEDVKNDEFILLNSAQMTRMNNKQTSQKSSNIPVKKNNTNNNNNSNSYDKNVLNSNLSVSESNRNSVVALSPIEKPQIIITGKDSTSNMNSNQEMNSEIGGKKSPREPHHPSKSTKAEQEQNKRSSIFRRSSSISIGGDASSLIASSSQQNVMAQIEKPVFSKSLTNKIAIKIANARNSKTDASRHSRTNSLNQSYNLNFTSDTLIATNKQSTNNSNQLQPPASTQQNNNLRKNSNNLNKSLNVLSNSSIGTNSNKSQVEFNNTNVNKQQSNTNNNNSRNAIKAKK